MVFELDRKNGTPLYLQIKDRISRWIEDGRLSPAERLPATRDLARSLRVNRHTVVKAYQELEVDGKVRSGVGRGTFVAEFLGHRSASVPEVRPEPADFDGLWGRNSRGLEHSGIAELFSCLPGDRRAVTALTSCLPETKSFPMREFRNCAYYALQNFGPDLLDIGPTQGFVPFLEYLPKYLLRHGMDAKPNELIVTNGIQQGIDLVARTLLDPGDTVITEEVTYPGAISTFHGLGAELVGIPVDAQGMKIEALEKVLTWRKPKLLYTIPTFQNPTGTTMSAPRRRQLLDLAERHKLPILEDQFANDLRVEGAPLLPLAAMDRRGWVISIGSLSKLLFHGLRVGWIWTPIDSLRRRLIALKQTADLQTGYLVQGIILEFIRRGYFEKYLKRRILQLRSRRDAMRDALKHYLGEDAWWYEVEGGVCYWLNLPAPLRADEVLLEARKRAVVFAPKRVFCAGAAPNDAMRLGFTDLDEERLRQGVRMIGQMVRKLQAAGSRSPAAEASDYARAAV